MSAHPKRSYRAANCHILACWPGAQFHYAIDTFAGFAGADASDGLALHITAASRLRPADL